VLITDPLRPNKDRATGPVAPLLVLLLAARLVALFVHGQAPLGTPAGGGLLGIGLLAGRREHQPLAKASDESHEGAQSAAITRAIRRQASGCPGHRCGGCPTSKDLNQHLLLQPAGRKKRGTDRRRENSKTAA